MNKEDLFEGFGALDDDLLKRSEPGGKIMKKGKTTNGILKYGSIAACLAVALGAGILFADNITPNPDAVPKSSVVGERNDHASAEQGNMQEKPERYVNISMLVNSNATMEEMILEFRSVEIEEHSARYSKVASVGSDVLKKSIGGEVEGTGNWYRVSGHEDMLYLISSNNDEYSLWKFDSFQQESYPYSDVMQIICNIHSAEDITKIIVSPANMDNSDEGRAIQEEIGTNVVADFNSIETIYNILSGLTCYGGDNWEMIGLGDDTPSSMLNQVKAGRYLTIVTSQGIEINTLKYTGISGKFYEYGGIAYSALTTEEKAAVEKILNIELQNEADDPATGQNKESEGKETQDSPVDEEAYQEAREYSVELTDLQNRINQAMMNHELPFVTSSAIYENPDRIHVCVNTTNEDLIAKLQAFDPTGKLLEIEYSEHSILE